MVKAIRLLQENEKLRHSEEDKKNDNSEDDDGDDEHKGRIADSETVENIEARAHETDRSASEVEQSSDDESGDEDNSDDDDLPLSTYWDLPDLPDTVIYRRLPCIAHCLQLVIKHVYKHSDYQPVITKVRSMVARIRKSPKLMDKLIRRCGKSVIMDCTTRWNSTFQMIRRFIDLKTDINEMMVTEESDVDIIVSSEWKLLNEVVNLLEPFANHTDILQTDTLSLSNVVPVLMDLEVHLQNFKSAKDLILVYKKFFLYNNCKYNKKISLLY